jgi:glycerate kinase
MKITVAIDSFKGSLSSLESGRAVEAAVARVFPGCEVAVCPLADGGEGTVEAIISATGGRICSVRVTDPLGAPITAEYGITPEGTAVIEMSAASGITLVPVDKRDPLYTTTYGTGELIAHAVKHNGCKRIIIGIGGSATNDGGAGMLAALGFGLLDFEGTPIKRGAVGLGSLSHIDLRDALPELSDCEILVACDVTNPLCGANGSSRVFGPQKGATEESVLQMDAWLSSFARLTENALGKDFSNEPGAGAAGGLGFALIAYLGARLKSGIEFVIDTVGLEDQIRDSDLVITGEGRLDGQTCMGKAPAGVATIAKKYGKPVIAFCGAATEDAYLVNQQGIDAYFPILTSPCTLSEAMEVERAEKNLRITAEQALRLARASGLK